MKRTIPTWRKYRLPRNLNPKSAQLVDSTKNIVHSTENGQVYKHGVYLHAAESFREANSCSSSLEFSSILWNSSIYYSVRKTPPLVPIHRQINPIHAFQSHIFKTYFHNIFPSMSMSSNLSLSFRRSYRKVRIFPHDSNRGKVTG